MAATNLNKASKEIILTLINQANGTLFSATDLTFGTPVIAPIGSTRNTDLDITGTGTTAFTGPVTVHYNRVDLAVLFANQTVEVPDFGNFTNHSDLLPSINAQFGLGLTIDDIQDQPIAYSSPDFPFIESIVANVNSLAYTGTFDLGLTDAFANGDIFSYKQSLGTAATTFIDPLNTTNLLNGSIDGEFALLNDKDGVASKLKMVGRVKYNPDTPILAVNNVYALTEVPNGSTWSLEFGMSYDFGATPARLSSKFDLIGSVMVLEVASDNDPGGTSFTIRDRTLETPAADGFILSGNGINAGVDIPAQLVSTNGDMFLLVVDALAFVNSGIWATAFPNTPLDATTGYPLSGVTFTLTVREIGSTLNDHRLVIRTSDPPQGLGF